MTQLDDFLTFWSDPITQQNHSSDPAKLLYDVRLNQLAQLAELNRRTLDFVVPISGSKGWSVGFDPDRTDDVARVASEIQATKEKLKSLSQDVAEFMTLSKGACTFRAPSDELSRFMRTGTMHQTTARRETRKAMRLNPKTLLEDIANMPAVKGAYEKLTNHEQETKNAIEDLKDRLQKMRAICEKHSHS